MNDILTSIDVLPNTSNIKNTDIMLMEQEDGTKKVIFDQIKSKILKTTLEAPTADSTTPAVVNTETEIPSLLQAIWNKLKHLFDSKAPISSPTFTNTPATPTPSIVSFATYNPNSPATSVPNVIGIIKAGSSSEANTLSGQKPGWLVIY